MACVPVAGHALPPRSAELSPSYGQASAPCRIGAVTRPAPVPRRATLTMLAIVIVAAALRAWGLTAGVPFRMAADEPAVLSIVLRMMQTGDFNPHFYDYGGLIFYLHLAVAVVTFLAGAMARSWQTVDQLWVGDLLTGGRIATVAMGTLTVFLVWRAALRWSVPIALLAAAVLAVNPQHVRESHFALTDVPLTLCVALALLLSLRAAEAGRPRAFAIAGLAAGAAAAIKYNGGLALLMPVAAVAALPATAVGPALAAAIGGAAAGYLAGAPYTLLDLPAFLNGFGVLLQSFNQPRPPSEVAVSYLKYVRNWFAWPGLSPLVGWLAVGVAAAGFLLAAGQAFARSTRARALVLCAFPAAYFALIVSQGSLVYGRYLLPLTPMLAIVAAIAVSAVWTRARTASRPARRLAPAALAVVLIAPPLVTSAAFGRTHARVTPGEQAAAWILEHVRPDEVLVVEMAAVRLPPRMRVENVPRLVARTIEEYRESGATYLVATSAAADRYDPEAHAAFERLRRQAQIVMAFPASAAHPGDTVTVFQVPRVP